jgi:hypothetical protein
LKTFESAPGSSTIEAIGICTRCPPERNKFKWNPSFFKKHLSKQHGVEINVDRRSNEESCHDDVMDEDIFQDKATNLFSAMLIAEGFR